MTDVFIAVINMSVAASFAAAAVLVARVLLRRAPRVISYALWAVVWLRFILPFSLTGVFSLIPIRPSAIPHNIAAQAAPHINSGIAAVDSFINGMMPQPHNIPAVQAGAPAAIPFQSASPMKIWLTIAAAVWLVGVVVMVLYSVISIIRLRRRLSDAVCVGGNIYEHTGLRTPFVLGLFRPRIYLPAGLDERNREYALLHERIHLRRRDHIVRHIAWFALAAHWFNPMAWAAFVCMNADMEQSCDERVIRKLGSSERAEYSSLLLDLAAGRRVLGGSPLAFSEGGVKGRVINMLKYKQRSKAAVAMCIVAALLLGFGLACSRENGIGVNLDESEWELYTFPYEHFWAQDNEPLATSLARITFDVQMPQPGADGITVTLTNVALAEEVVCGKYFRLVKRVVNDWRAVPFGENARFEDIAIMLTMGQSYDYGIRADFFAAELTPGDYRVITDVWYTAGDELEYDTGSEHKTLTVWAEFRVSEDGEYINHLQEISRETALSAIRESIDNRIPVGETYIANTDINAGLAAMLAEYNEQTVSLTAFFNEKARGVLDYVAFSDDWNPEVPPYYPMSPGDYDAMLAAITQNSLYVDCTQRFLDNSLLGPMIEKEAGGSAGMWAYWWHTFYLDDHEDIKEGLAGYFTLVDKILGQLE